MNRPFTEAESAEDARARAGSGGPGRAGRVPRRCAAWSGMNR